jgi:hypothetical protein
MDLIAFQFRVFLRRGQDGSATTGVDRFGKPATLHRRMPEQLP